MPSPRSSWSRPFFTAARNSTRSAISSIEQSSGNSRIVFRTTSFSVMRKIMLPGASQTQAFPPDKLKVTVLFSERIAHRQIQLHRHTALEAEQTLLEFPKGVNATGHRPHFFRVAPN